MQGKDVRPGPANRNPPSLRRHIASIPESAWPRLTQHHEALVPASFPRNKRLSVSQTRHESSLVLELGQCQNAQIKPTADGRRLTQMKDRRTTANGHELTRIEDCGYEHTSQSS